MNKTDVVVLLSGGMDSAVLLADYCKEEWQVRTISFNYGQRHSKELVAAAALAEWYHVPNVVIDMSSVAQVLGGSSQTDLSVPVPEGHYAAENMKKTVVPNRNMIMLSVAAAYAITCDAAWVAFAAHAGDHTIYPDCRREFVDALHKAFQLCDWKQPKLIAPFVHMHKWEIAKFGGGIGVPFHLTWSCYNGREKHCGKCGTCVERKEAFEKAGLIDPAVYEDK